MNEEFIFSHPRANFVSSFLILHSAFPQSHLQLTVRTGHPHLFRARFVDGLPVHRAGHRRAHLRKPPLRPRHAVGELRAAGADLAAVETEFELFIGRHNMPFFRRHFGRGGRTKAVQAKNYLKKVFRGNLRKTSNTEHPTSNVQCKNWMLGVRCWAFDVGCWMLDVPLKISAVQSHHQSPAEYACH